MTTIHFDGIHPEITTRVDHSYRSFWFLCIFLEGNSNIIQPRSCKSEYNIEFTQGIIAMTFHVHTFQIQSIEMKGKNSQLHSSPNNSYNPNIHRETASNL